MANLAMQEDLDEAVRYRTLLEMVVDYAYTFRIEPDGSMLCEWASPGFERLTGYTPDELLALGGYERLVHPEDLPLSRQRAEAVLHGEAVSDYLRIVTRGGEVRWVKDTVRPEVDAQGRVVRLCGAARDVTERRQAVAALRETQQLLEGILANSQDGIVILDETGRIANWNPALEEMTGLAAHDVLGLSLATVLTRLHTELIGEDVSEPRSQDLDSWLRTGEAPWVGRLVEGRITTARGDQRVVQASSFQVPTFRGWRFGLIARDTTTRVEILEALRASEQRLRDLASRTGTALEEERAHMAREIHDGLGQTLTAIQFDLAWLRRRLRRASPEVIAKLQAMVAELDDAIGSVQELARTLRPHLLDELGLAATVEWQLQRFTERYGVPHTLRIEPEEPAVAREVATALFRILQEALTNVARHARATAVDVHLAQDADGVRLTVRDNGRGITPEEAASPNALGLIGMDERAARCGGSVDIVGRPGHGTTVSVFIPFKGGTT